MFCIFKQDAKIIQIKNYFKSYMSFSFQYKTTYLYINLLDKLLK